MQAQSRSFSYHIVDVFTQIALEGNALAVFPDAAGIEDALMQKIARELNLSETVFVFPSERADCAARLRIFTPSQEVPFAGHPTVGSSFVLLTTGKVSKDSGQFGLEELVGRVPVRVEQGDEGRPLIWLTTPPIRYGSEFERALCAEVLGLTEAELLPIRPQVVSAGNPNLFIALRDKSSVDQAFLEMRGMKRLKGTPMDAQCVFVFTPTPEGAYSRMFAPEHGIVEDPATGSATGPLAAYMVKHKLTPNGTNGRFVSEQGTRMGRRSLLHIQLHGAGGTDGIEVGGYVTPLARGELSLSL